MASISATAARKDIYRLIEQVNSESTPVTITTSKGKGAVLIGEDDWSALEETLALVSIPGMLDELTTAKDEPLDRCVTEDALDW